MRVILLTQTSGLTELQKQRPQIEALLRLPGVAGFSLRIPAKVANTEPGNWLGLSALAGLAGEIAIAGGNKEVQLRMMYGRWCPPHAAWRWGRFPGGSLGGTDVNLPAFDYPLTFHRLGGPARRFMRWVKEAQAQLVTETYKLRDRGLPVDVVHFSHPAGTWAEVFVIEQMASYRGYSPEAVVGFHADVMRSANLAWEGYSEFALSGHVTPDSIRGYVYGTLSNVAREGLGGILINRNDIRNETNFAGMPTGYPLGWQSYAAGNSYRASNGQTVTYDWPLVFSEAEKRNVIYYEAYPGNFSPEFQAEIASRYG